MMSEAGGAWRVGGVRTIGGVARKFSRCRMDRMDKRDAAKFLVPRARDVMSSSYR